MVKVVERGGGITLRLLCRVSNLARLEINYIIISYPLLVGA